jgi:hypothetical protein
MEFLFVCFCFCNTGVWTQSFTFAKQVLYHLSHTLSPFCFTYFSNRISHLRWDWLVLPIYSFCIAYLQFLHSWDNRCQSPCPAFIDWAGVSQTFSLGCSGTGVLLLSTSQAVSITDVSHCVLSGLFSVYSQKNFCLVLVPKDFCLCFYPKTFMALHFTFNFVAYFEFVFL